MGAGRVAHHTCVDGVKNAGFMMGRGGMTQGFGVGSHECCRAPLPTPEKTSGFNLRFSLAIRDCPGDADVVERVPAWRLRSLWGCCLSYLFFYVVIHMYLMFV